MALHGSSFPLDDGSFVTTVHCPNAFAHQRLMQAINNIVPDAGDPPQQPNAITLAAIADSYEGRVEATTPYIAGFEPNEDGVIVKGGCATGSCDLE